MSGNNLGGVYRGVVTDARDPERRGRVQLRVPLVSGDEQIWAPVVAQGRTAFIPEAGNEVLVAFEGGDPRSPFVLGALWDSSEIPPD